MKLLKYFLICLILSFNFTAVADWVYTIRPNDTIGSIVDRYLIDDIYIELLLQHNEIYSIENLKPGQRINVPFHWLKINPLPVEAISFSGQVIRIFKDTNGANLSRQVKLGESFKLGDRVLTGENSSIILKFADGSQVSLKENSDVTFDLLSTYGEEGMVDSKLLLNKGRLDVEVDSGKNSHGIYRFEVKTPLAISAVRGTKYSIDYISNNTSIALYEGKNIVGFADRDNEEPLEESDTGTVTLTQGFGTFIKSNGQLNPPIKLLSAINLADIDTQSVNQGIRMISWKAQKGASSYSVEVATDKDFNEIVWMSIVNSNSILPNFINEDSAYYLKIRANDSNGIPGFPTTVELLPNLYPSPPSTFSPGHLDILDDNNVKFNWIGDKNQDYVIEVSTDKSLNNLVVSKLVRGTQANIEIQANNKSELYYWRIAQKGSDGKLGEWGLINNFVIGLFEIKDDLIILPQLDNIIGYRLQVFKDSGLQNKIWDETYYNNDVKIPKHLIGNLFYRVAVIDVNNRQSNFSEYKSVSQAESNWVKYIFISAMGLLFLL